jgi:hypothetical protein
MKYLSNLFAIALLFGFSACNSNAQTNAEANTTQAAVVEVIDFHNTHRCMTCQTIEDKAKAALQEKFPEAMAQGQLVFKTVNVDLEENYNVAAEFEAAGTALFVNTRKNGQSEKTDLTNFAFMNATSDNGKFEAGLIEEVEKALQQL